MAEYFPEYCVWETTLACNLRCLHCGSAAGSARAEELSTAEALHLIDQLAGLGTREVTFSGGEFLLRPDWRELLSRARECGVERLVVSNGMCISQTVAEELSRQGVLSVSISLDGGRSVHNRLRPLNKSTACPTLLADPTAKPDSFSQAMASIRNLKRAGLTVAAITQVCRINLGDLPAVREILDREQIADWQVQLTNPMGRVSTGEARALAPGDLPPVYDFIREVQRESRIRCLAAHSIGYFGADEHFLRSQRRGAAAFWTGCGAGTRVIGITSDGGVKGCLSMPDSLIEANIRQRPLRDIWNGDGYFAYNRGLAGQSLTGKCGDCEFARLCRGGCHSLAYSAAGRMTENPYCIRHVRNI